MLDFRPVTLDDSTLLRRLLGGEGRICDSTAGTVLMWRRYFDTRIAFAGETAVLRASYRGRDVLYTSVRTRSRRRGRSDH